MKIWLLRFCFLLIFLILQVTLFSYISIAGAKVDILLIVSIYFGFKSGMMSGQITGFFAGFFQDLLSYKYFGINMFIKTIIGASIGKAHKKFFSESFFAIFMIIFVLTFIASFMKLTLINVFFDSNFTWDIIINYFIDVFIIEMFLNSLVAPFIFSFLDRFNLLDNQEI